MRLTLPQALAWMIYRDHSQTDTRASVFDVLNDAVRDASDDEEKAQRPLSSRDDLVAKLRSGELIAYGLKVDGVLHEEIPPIHWEAIDSLSTLPNCISSTDIGKGDTTVYRDVLVDSDVVCALWPASDKMASYRTGGPGKPSPTQFIVIEWRRRRDSGEALPTLKDESEALHEWCINAHPAIAAPQPTTIANRIRKEYQSFRGASHN